MVLSETATLAVGKTAVALLRARLDEAVLARLRACGTLEPYSTEWDEAYHEASKPIFAIQEEWRGLMRVEYNRIWGPNATGAYFLPAHALNREERMSVHRVGQMLASQAQPK